MQGSPFEKIGTVTYFAAKRERAQAVSALEIGDCPYFLRSQDHA